MLSSQTLARLQTATQNEGQYLPNSSVRQQIADKQLVMFVGPAATGKSFLINHLAAADPDFGRVAVFTTRPPRPDDEPGMFRTRPHDDAQVSELLNKIEAGEVVQYAVHPTTGNLYGSEPTDYQRQFNMLATLSGVVDGMRKLPFAATRVIGVAVEPDVWLERFYDRYPGASEERTKRLGEAIVSLEWLLTDTHTDWIDNTSPKAEATIQSLINIVKYNQPADATAKQLAERLLERLHKE